MGAICSGTLSQLAFIFPFKIFFFVIKVNFFYYIRTDVELWMSCVISLFLFTTSDVADNQLVNRLVVIGYSYLKTYRL